MIEDRYKYNSVDMAKFIVAYANEHNFGINMTKLQKLLYIAYGTFMSVKNYRLVNEHPQAWPYGPVFPTTRNKLLKTDMSKITFENVGEIKDDEEVKQLVKIVFDNFGLRTGADLSAWSHKPNSPWDLTVNTKGFKWGDQIPDAYIQDYFNSILVRNEAQQ